MQSSKNTNFAIASVQPPTDEEKQNPLDITRTVKKPVKRKGHCIRSTTGNPDTL